jgi:hypothetical protein
MASFLRNSVGNKRKNGDGVNNIHGSYDSMGTQTEEELKHDYTPEQIEEMRKKTKIENDINEENFRRRNQSIKLQRTGAAWENPLGGRGRTKGKKRGGKKRRTRKRSHTKRHK